MQALATLISSFAVVRLPAHRASASPGLCDLMSKSGFAQQLSSWFIYAADTGGRWRERARSRRALSHLDDHLLRDIGVTQAQLMIESSKPFWRA